MLKALKIALFNALLKYVYNLTTLDAIIRVHYTDKAKTKGFITVGDRRLTESEQREFVNDAKIILKLQGHSLVTRSICADATYKLINKSKTIDDMVFSKAVLYAMDMEDATLRTVSNLSQ